MSKVSFRKSACLLVIVTVLSFLVTGCTGNVTTPESGQAQETSSNAQAEGEGASETNETSDPVQEENNNSNSGEQKEENTAEGNNEETANNNNAEKDESIQQPSKNKVKVKALYLTGWTVGSDKKLKHYIELANTTEINAYVVDIKDDDGYVGYESQVPEVREIKAYKKKYDVDKVLKEFHDNNIHIIGRLVCFKDPVLATKKPELAVKNVNGGLWKERTSEGAVPWVNPANRDSWPYLISIAKEAVEKGFDEIQFDYVRFPTGNKKVMDFGKMDKEKYEIINEFLAYARKELPGVILSADVFGIICESPKDTEDIGQYLELIGKDIDYISPMVYPSHYAVGQTVNGVRYVKPDLEPYGVVYNSLVKAKRRIEAVEDYKADVRPYIQDFTASWLGDGYYMTYGPEQVRQQIKAVYDAGYEEWILWDALNTYSESALLKEDNN